MDFVAREIFYLFWFSLILVGGTFGALTGAAPPNQAVVVGKPVKITCSSDTDGNLIKWSLKAVGDPNEGDGKTIKEGNANIKDTDNYSGAADGKSYTLTINKASQSTAGMYVCVEGGSGAKLSTLLIVLEQTCDYSPKPTNTHPCGSTLHLSCIVNYFVTPIYLSNTLQLTWSSEPTTEGLDAENSSPPTETTRNSTLDVKLLADVKTMPIYKCETTIAVNKDKLLDTTDLLTVTFNNTCKPFAEATDVPCGGKDDTEKTKGSSVRSAETNNLAIRVLGVAGVLLLAQMF